MLCVDESMIDSCVFSPVIVEIPFFVAGQATFSQSSAEALGEVLRGYSLASSVG